ncbi:APC family permease [[Mycobacterium] wendilense]|uniref:APC family permease n=1 Tax=[Mycobacterium] wendilense TaxID=3064284 RepID=A0ABM9MFS1_9MYCO|nr:APC family permease [Mycolicibacterium sp. MU0050]CAJ1584096.1 APC family permease [Mycolicibacterium sp. MU0050]
MVAPVTPVGLPRRLGLVDAAVLGMGAMLGAGIFAALAPAAQAAGPGLLLGLAVAALVASCNALSTARLAIRYPVSGGAYIYGRRRLGDFWGYLAGWGFIVGKTASCAAIALTVGHYAWPAAPEAVAVTAVIVVTVVNYLGVQKSALVTRVIVGVVLTVLGAVVVTAWTAGSAGQPLASDPPASVPGVLQSAALLFFAFAGYARIATLGEEVREPARVIPRAMLLALSVTVLCYGAVAVAVLGVLGPQRLTASAAPLVAAVEAAGAPALMPVVAATAVIAAIGSLLALLLGVSRTVLAMARDRYLPTPLAAVHPRFGGPHRAELAVGVVVAVLAATVDLRSAIGFSSFGVLVYYTIANAAAFTLDSPRGRSARVIPVLGILGCLSLAFALPASSVVAGVTVFAVGAAGYGLRRLVG